MNANSNFSAEENPKMWLHMDDREMDRIINSVKDQNLKLTLAFGIGMHHAGLVDRDRRTVEELFVNQKIQVRLISFHEGFKQITIGHGICYRC
jgi:replicative superfamily II helicase